MASVGRRGGYGAGGSAAGEGAGGAEGGAGRLGLSSGRRRRFLTNSDAKLRRLDVLAGGIDLDIGVERVRWRLRVSPRRS